MDYTISQFETMFSIAQKFGISLQDLLNFNHLTDGSRIFPGMIIKIPNFRPRPPIPPRPPQPPANKIYTVRHGDTLGHIAQMHGVSVENLMHMNDVENLLLAPGQRLTIPMGITPFGSEH